MSAFACWISLLGIKPVNKGISQIDIARVERDFGSEVWGGVISQGIQWYLRIRPYYYKHRVERDFGSEVWGGVIPQGIQWYLRIRPYYYKHRVERDFGSEVGGVIPQGIGFWGSAHAIINTEIIHTSNSSPTVSLSQSLSNPHDMSVL